MRRKKLLAICLAGIMALGLVGCGSDGDKKKDEKATISVQVEKAWKPYYEQVKARVLEKHPNATINFIEIGSFDHLDNLDETDPTNKDIADVFSIPVDRLYGLSSNNALAPIDAEKMAEEVGGFKDFKGGLGGNLKVGNEYLAFPYNIETLIAYVNKENAAKYGIDTSKPIEFNNLDPNSMLVKAHDAWFGVAFTNAAKFELLDKDGDKLSTDGIKDWKDLNQDQQKLFESLYKYWKPHYDAKDNLWDKKAADGFMTDKFSEKGGAALRIDGPWATTDLSKKIGADNLEVIPLSNITVNGNALSHWKGGWGLAINARCEENEAQMTLAQDFIKELVNPKYAQDLFKSTGKILENVEAKAYDGIGGIDEKVIKATYASYEKSISRPLFEEYGKVWDTWQNALLSWSAQKPANAEEAYKQVQASFQAMMGSIKK
ncbi:MAG: sugar ABC transporter substrate-binding protein [Clostridium sp.]